MGGYADTDSFDNLADCHDLIALTKAPEAGPITEVSLYALKNIQDRFEKTEKMGATGEEIKALLALVDFAEDFWSRQSGTVFADVYNQLRAERKKQAA